MYTSRLSEPGDARRTGGSGDLPEGVRVNGKYHDDGTDWNGHVEHGDARHGIVSDGWNRRPDDAKHAHGSALHHENGKVHRRNENHLFVRRSDGLQHDAEPVHDAARRHVLLLLHDERHDGLLLQPDHGHVQVRNDQRRLLLDLHLG